MSAVLTHPEIGREDFEPPNGGRLASLLRQHSLPAPGVGRAPSKLLRSDGFQPGYAYRLPAFCQNLPAFPKIAGRDGFAMDCVRQPVSAVSTMRFPGA